MKQEGILKSAAQALAIGFGYIAGIYAGMAAVDKIKEYLDKKKAWETDSEGEESNLGSFFFCIRENYIPYYERNMIRVWYAIDYINSLGSIPRGMILFYFLFQHERWEKHE